MQLIKIERLMDENAQLRAEKMLLTTTTTTASIFTSKIHSNQSQNSLFSPTKPLSEELSLYSTVKNKHLEKQNNLNDFLKLDHNSPIDYPFDEYSNNLYNNKQTFFDDRYM